MLDDILQLFHQNISHRIWFISDLQQSIPENAARCMRQGIQDFRQLNLECDRIIYLGDAVEGANLGHLEDMTEMQVKNLKDLDIPVRYVIGNHDFDYFRRYRESLAGVSLPFYETIKEVPGWKATASIEDFCFIEEFDDFALVYLSDHAAMDGSWFTIHGKVFGDSSLYPYDDAFFEELRAKIADLNKPVFTASHYAFPGGNRPSPLLERLLPLPDNVKTHFYGHAHIGDKVWVGKDCYRKISYVDDHNIPQIDVASFENIRGNAVRSVFFEIYQKGGYGILFRNHTLAKWEEVFFINT